MMRLSSNGEMSRPLAALLSVLLVLSAWLHAGPSHARALPADLLVLVETGDQGLMVLPRESLEQRSREADGSSDVPPWAGHVSPSPAPGLSSPPVSSPDMRDVPPVLCRPATNPAAPRAPPSHLPS